MEPFDTVPAFLLFAFQGCNAPGLFSDTFSQQPLGAVVRPVTIPLVLLLGASAAMLIGALLWWREVPKGGPMGLIGMALLAVLGFIGYQAYDVVQISPSFTTFLDGENYYIAVGEFSFYLLFAAIMILVSLILVARETGWETERNLLILSTGSIVILTVCWVLFSFAVWNCTS